MATNLTINKLIEEARSVSQCKTKKAVVTETLVEYIQRRKQLMILESFGRVHYEKNYHYNKQRKEVG